MTWLSLSSFVGRVLIRHTARAPDEFAECMEKVSGLRKKKHLTSEEAERVNARIGLIHLSDEHIGYGDLCPKDDSVDAPISLIRYLYELNCASSCNSDSINRCDSRLVLMYPQFDYILRNHWHPKLKMYGDKIRWFPLGHSTGSLRRILSQASANFERKTSQVTAGRRRMQSSPPACESSDAAFEGLAGRTGGIS